MNSVDGNVIAGGVQTIAQSTTGNPILDLVMQHLASISPVGWGAILLLLFLALSITKFKTIAKIIQIGLVLLIFLILLKIVPI